MLASPVTPSSSSKKFSFVGGRSHRAVDEQRHLGARHRICRAEHVDEAADGDAVLERPCDVGLERRCRVQSVMQPRPVLTTETDEPLESNRTFVQPHRPVSSASRNQSFGSDIARTVYVPPGRPVMSIHWCGRLQRYVSAHPTEMPVRDVSAVRPPQPRLAIDRARRRVAAGSGTTGWCRRSRTRPCDRPACLAGPQVVDHHLLDVPVVVAVTRVTASWPRSSTRRSPPAVVVDDLTARPW